MKTAIESKQPLALGLSATRSASLSTRMELRQSRKSKKMPSTVSRNFGNWFLRNAEPLFFLKEVIFGVFNYTSYFFNLHTYIHISKRCKFNFICDSGLVHCTGLIKT